ncbi:uncharacterized protein PRCAT00001831001 [Priceomyces carsonii]|uniref:uncharacterized protein n=1 Tax=Priceomyces carsonii TaxID=28549 RepID=UPI002ED82972|nr:unnamed protein product [Priceomyces carsonii]
MSSHLPRAINLSQLQPQQLLELRKSTEQEVNHFTNSLQALQTAQSKLKDCITSINKMEASDSKDLLVPLTSSLYLPGKVEAKDNYLVDIGTGYFVSKLAKDARKVYETKIIKLDNDAKKLKDILLQKNEIMNSINMTLRSKMIEYEKQQEQQQQS